MINILSEIGWRSHEDHIALRGLNGNQFQDRCKEIIECIKQYAEKRLRDKLDKMSKYRYLVSQFRIVKESSWFRELPRWARIPVARLVLSQHRLLVETGRWRRWPRDYRICKDCAK